MLLHLVFGLSVFSMGFGDQVPSQFDYESQLLDKMVRMELVLEKMEERINKSHEKVETGLQNVTTTLEKKTAEIRTLEERVDIPVVAFHAYGPEDLSIDTNQKLILKTAAVNLGGRYDRYLGMFTAPVTGLYMFTAHICNQGSIPFYYYIVREGSVIAKSTKFNNVQHDCGSCFVITQVTAGQRVWIHSPSGSTTSNQFYEDSYRQSSFSGVLLHK